MVSEVAHEQAFDWSVGFRSCRGMFEHGHARLKRLKRLKRLIGLQR
jgi:hypothetical protein